MSFSWFQYFVAVLNTTRSWSTKFVDAMLFYIQH